MPSAVVLDSAEAARRAGARKLADVKPPPPPLPDPEITWRPPTKDELADCKSAKSLLTKAEKAGWDVQAWYSKGPYIGADGQPLGDSQALVLIFRWQHPEAYAVWYHRGEKWELGSAWLLAPIVRVGGNDIGHWLAGTQPKEKKS